MDSPISPEFQGDYQKIKDMVVMAKEAQQDENYKSAKKHFLDAASISLSISKKINTIEEVTFRNIARILIDSAKEMQLIIDMENDPLPPVPGSQNLPVKDELVFSKKNDPKLLELMIISNSGLPIFVWAESKITDQEQNKVNDILFSGAITAVNSLISEVLSKPIQSIQIEDGNITLRFRSDHTFVAFFKGKPKALEDNVEKFSKEFCDNILPRAQSDINQGKSLNSDEETINLVHSCFVI